MAASADQNRVSKPAREYSGEVVSGSTIYGRTGVAVDTGGTTATGGRMRAFSSAEDRALLGFSQEQRIGDYDGEADGSGVKVETSEFGGYRYLLTVTGVTGRWDVGKDVFMTDDNTWTLTRAANAVFVGVVDEHVSSTSCYVRAVDPLILAQRALDGVPVTFSVNIAGTATGVRAQHKLPFAGSLESVECNVDEALASAGISNIALQMRIRAAGTSSGAAGTTVTGGAITVQSSNSVGDAKTGSAVSANNRFSEGDYLQVAITPGTTVSATGKVTVNAILRARYGT